MADHWDFNTSSWSILFCRLLKEEEIIDFQNLMSIIANKKNLNKPDRRIWSLEGSGVFSVKSLVKHLSMASPIEYCLEKGLWKTKNPHRVNITVWIMLFGTLNCAAILQRKLPSPCLSPHIRLCLENHEDLPHLFFECGYAKKCWSLFVPPL